MLTTDVQWQTVGHFSRECPKEKDWSRVQCNNCGESKFGVASNASKSHAADDMLVSHTAKRCPKPDRDAGEPTAAGSWDTEDGRGETEADGLNSGGGWSPGAGPGW